MFNVLIGICGTVLFCGIVCMLVGQIGVVNCRKTGVPFQRAGKSPWNIVFQPEDLTAQGLLYRRLYFLGLLCTIIAAVPVYLLLKNHHDNHGSSGAESQHHFIEQSGPRSSA